MKIVLILICSLFLSCAHTTFYSPEGKKVAVFQGDMTNVEFSMTRQGDIIWLVSKVDHSTATKAQGEAASAKLTATGSALAATLTALALFL